MGSVKPIYDKIADWICAGVDVLVRPLIFVDAPKPGAVFDTSAPNAVDTSNVPSVARANRWLVTSLGS